MQEEYYLKKDKWILIIKIALLVIFVVAAYNIGKTYYEYNEAKKVYNDLQGKYVEIVDEPILSEGADKSEEKGLDITIDFEQLLTRNEDVVGWLYCPDTVLNYPVVQGEDNDEYLHADLDGNYLKSGSLFVDYRNGALGDDLNYIIYGHSMKNGSMFRMLLKYRDQAYYDAHPVYYYLTPDANYELELFAGLIVNEDDRIYSHDLTYDEFFDMIDSYTTRSTFKSDVIPDKGDMIITLSTCSYEYDEARYIVLGRLKQIE